MKNAMQSYRTDWSHTQDVTFCLISTKQKYIKCNILSLIHIQLSKMFINARFIPLSCSKKKDII